MQERSRRAPVAMDLALLQVHLDAIGRCLSSMPPGATRARVGRQVADWLDDEKIQASVDGTPKATEFWCARRYATWSTGPVDQLKVAVEQLTTLADACHGGRRHPPFRAHYVMEAGSLEAVLPKGMMEHLTARVCVWCGKKERTRRCSRCRNAWYCSTTCQRGVWEDGHKHDCTTFQVDSALAEIRQRGIRRLTRTRTLHSAELASNMMRNSRLAAKRRPRRGSLPDPARGEGTRGRAERLSGTRRRLEMSPS